MKCKEAKLNMTEKCLAIFTEAVSEKLRGTNSDIKELSHQEV